MYTELYTNLVNLHALAIHPMAHLVSCRHISALLLQMDIYKKIPDTMPFILKYFTTYLKNIKSTFRNMKNSTIF